MVRRSPIRQHQDLVLSPSDYETSQTNHKGSGLPPFNSTMSPIAHFCYLQACNCGDTSNFKKALYPYYMGWGGPYLENQALWGYTCYTRVSDRISNTEVVWQKLVVGWTARATWNWVRDFYLPTNGYGIQMSDAGGDPPTDWRDPVIGDYALICGPDNGAMRLKTVYTGNDTPPTSSTTPWYFPL